METRKLPSILDLMAAIWLIISPFALGFTGVRVALYSDVAVGGLVLILAASRLLGTGLWASWASTVLGTWVLVSPPIAGYLGHASADLNAATSVAYATGFAIMAFSIWSSFVLPDTDTLTRALAVHRHDPVLFSAALPREEPPGHP